MKNSPLIQWYLVSPGKHLPEVVNSIIEIPKGSKGKYVLDKGTGLLSLTGFFSPQFNILQITDSSPKHTAMTMTLWKS